MKASLQTRRWLCPSSPKLPFAPLCLHFLPTLSSRKPLICFLSFSFQNFINGTKRYRFFKITFYFLLGYSWSATLWWFQTNNTGTQASSLVLSFAFYHQVSSAYLRLLIFLPAILISACASSSLAFRMMYSAYMLNKQGDSIQPWRMPFPRCTGSLLEPIHCSM